MSNSFGIYDLSQTEVDQLMRPIVGQGGWQSYLRRLQKSMRGVQLHVSEEDFNWVSDHARLFIDGNGGWQRRVPKMLKDDALDFATST